MLDLLDFQEFQAILGSNRVTIEVILIFLLTA